MLLVFHFCQTLRNILLFTNDVVKISGFGQARWVSVFSVEIFQGYAGSTRLIQNAKNKVCI